MGTELVTEGNDLKTLNSSHIDAKGKFYYSCRNSKAPFTGYDLNTEADTVAVYDLDSITVARGAPFVTSTDPSYVQSVCPVVVPPKSGF